MKRKKHNKNSLAKLFSIIFMVAVLATSLFAGIGLKTPQETIMAYDSVNSLDINVYSGQTSWGAFKVEVLEGEANIESESYKPDPQVSYTRFTIPFTGPVKIRITAVSLNSEFYTFLSYAGLDAGEEATGSSIIIDLVPSPALEGRQRTIEVVFTGVEKDFAMESDLTNANGRLVAGPDTDLSKIAIGTAYHVKFEPQKGYRVREWMVRDKEGNWHNVSDADIRPFITINEDTLILNATEEWFEKFGYTLDLRLKTIMNPGLFATLLILVIVLPLVATVVMIALIIRKQLQLAWIRSIEFQRQNEARMQGADKIKKLIDDAKKEE